MDPLPVHPSPGPGNPNPPVRCSGHLVCHHPRLSLGEDTSIRPSGRPASERGSLSGITAAASNVEKPPIHCGTLIKAARTPDPGTKTLDPGTIGLGLIRPGNGLKSTAPIAWYVGKGAFGMEGLRGKLGPERRSVEVPIAVGRLGRPSEVGASFKEGAVVGCLSPSSLWGRQFSTAFASADCGCWIAVTTSRSSKVRPGAQCGRCSGWGPVEAQCTRGTCCGLCAGDHRTDRHKRPAEGCSVKKGQTCVHGVAKCPNCKGPHTTQANCTQKRRRPGRPPKGGGRRREGAEMPSPPASPPPEATTAGDDGGRGDGSGNGSGGVNPGIGRG